MLTRTFLGCGAGDFAVACRRLVADAVGARVSARLVDDAGAVLLEVDHHGRARDLRPVVVGLEAPRSHNSAGDDGWYRAGETVFVVHAGRAFSVVVGEALVVAAAACLPGGAAPLLEEELGELHFAAGELVEAFCRRHAVEVRSRESE